ncbi:ARF guanine-nucleotide exchange factor GNL2-like [Chenopodium quinoa]|uniref:ARF guanine-nucleotide exchange factor GNL2-like n=1 Tax=Chenopodium quinoa TaxID=63459 RepID=UPI000B78B32B|nr:ARF guanine-nucleotide exchange factor GNL2-like [Chenopodium quinoa]
MTKKMKKDIGFSCTINTEVGSVLAALRNSNELSASEDNYHDTAILQQSLKSLRSLIFNPRQEWQYIDPSIYLSPFLDVIQSDDVPAAATNIALSSLIKLLKIQVFDEKTPGAQEAMNALVMSTTSCRLERTDPLSEEGILMKVLLLLNNIMMHPGSCLLKDECVCRVINTTFQVVQQSSNRGNLLQRAAKFAMLEISQMVFSRLDSIEVKEGENSESESEELDVNDIVNKGFGLRCVVDIFQFLCSLLNVVQMVEIDGIISQSNDEDIQILALMLINTALELSGDGFSQHPKLRRMVGDDLFHHLIHYGTRSSALILSMICSTVLNSYNFLHGSLRLQLEAFFTFVLFRVAKFGSSVRYQEVALEGIINLCRQPTFLIETYVNYDCAFMCCNVFEEMGKLLCKLAFPMTTPLTSLQLQAFEGLIIIIQAIADKVNNGDNTVSFEPFLVEITEYSPFWEEPLRKDDLENWVHILRLRKAQKKKLLIAGTHFNQDEKKGLEYLKISHLIPNPPEAKAFAYFFRFTPGLNKTAIGDYLGDPDEFHLQVLNEFTHTFDFTGFVLDTALRTYLESFRLPGESQKIHRILEAFSERFFNQQSSELFETKDAVFILCYSLIMLNTDQHNPQVKKKMTEEEFIRNNRAINNGKDLPREYLSELFQSIATHAIAIFAQSATLVEMNPSRWVELISRSKFMNPFIVCDFDHRLGRDMFGSIAGPTVSALSAIFEHADDDEVLNECIEGMVSVARIARHGLEDILDELVASLCKFTTLLNPYASAEETLYLFSNELKPRMATLAVFNIANKFGESIRGAWRNIVDCMLKLKRLKLLPQSVVDYDTLVATESELQSRNISEDSKFGSSRGNNSMATGRLSHFLLDGNEELLNPGGSEFEQNLKIIQQCKIGNIFSNSSKLPVDTLLNLGRTLIFAAAGKGQKFTTALEEEETVTFCWDIVGAIAYANIDRFSSFWPAYYDYIGAVTQFPLFSPVPFAEKAAMILFKLCVKLLSSYQTDKYAEEVMFKSISLMWKLDKEILDTCCETIIQTVCKILTEFPGNVQTPIGWKTLLQLLSTNGRLPENYDQAVKAIIQLLSDGKNMTRNNYAYCIDCAFGFVALRTSLVEKNIQMMDLMANSVKLLIQWYKDNSDPGSSISNGSIASSSEDKMKLFVKLGEALRKTSLARREEVRNHAVASLKKSFELARDLELTSTNTIIFFNHVIFAMVDDLHEKMLDYSRRENAEREMRSMEGTLKNAMELLTDVFLLYLKSISGNPGFRSFWLGLLRRMDTCVKADLGVHGPSRMQQVVPELLKKIIAVMKDTGVLEPRENDDFWDITYIQIQWIAPSLEGEMFPYIP